jgi:hypothetical protein
MNARKYGVVGNAMILILCAFAGAGAENLRPYQSGDTMIISTDGNANAGIKLSDDFMLIMCSCGYAVLEGGWQYAGGFAIDTSVTTTFGYKYSPSLSSYPFTDCDYNSRSTYTSGNADTVWSNATSSPDTLSPLDSIVLMIGPTQYDCPSNACPTSRIVFSTG